MPNITPRFCLLAIVLVTTFFWYRSVQVREPWNVPTFMHYSSWAEHHQHIAAKHLAYANNWLKEGPSALYFGQYMYPKSIEMQELAQRKYHPSYPPMVTFGLYALFKALEVTGVIPDIYHKRGIQVLIAISLNHILHFILALSMCLLVFVVCRKLGFDELNSALMAITPAIVLLHNAGTLYWYNHLFIAPIVIVPLFTLYILLELLRCTNSSPRLRKVIRVGQPLLMFLGVFTGWLFPFVITTVYVMRMIKKEIALPWLQFFSWGKQTLLFFLPAVLALGIWGWTIVFYQQHAITTSFFDAPTSAMGNTMTHNLLHKMGLIDFQGNIAGLDEKIFWYKKAFYEHIVNDFGIVAFLLLLGTAYLVIRSRKQVGDSIASQAYLLLLAPIVLYGLTVDDANHYFTSVKYAPALSAIFVLAPILVLQIQKRDILTPALTLFNGKSIALVTVIGLLSSTLWAYTQIYSEKNVIRLFTPPKFQHLAVGSFVNKHTDFNDVVFSSDYYFQHPAFVIYSFFTIKAMHFADNLDMVYEKTSHIDEEFTVKIFYYQSSQRAMSQLKTFLESNGLATTTIGRRHTAGELLAFDGRQFQSWYKNEYCKEFPDTPDLC